MIFYSELNSVQIALVRSYTYTIAICESSDKIQGFNTSHPPLSPVEYFLCILMYTDISNCNYVNTQTDNISEQITFLNYIGFIKTWNGKLHFLLYVLLSKTFKDFLFPQVKQTTMKFLLF